MKRAMPHKKNHSVLYPLLLLFSILHQASYASSSSFNMTFHNHTNDHTVLLYKGKEGVCAKYHEEKSAVIPPKAPPHTMTFDQYKSCHNVKAVFVVAIKDKTGHILCTSNIVFYMHGKPVNINRWLYKIDFDLAPGFPSKTPKCEAKNIPWHSMFKSNKRNGKHKIYNLNFTITQSNSINFSSKS